MDGRGRLAEPVSRRRTSARSAGAAPASPDAPRASARRFAQPRFRRIGARWLAGPIGSGAFRAAPAPWPFALLLAVSLGYGTVARRARPMVVRPNSGDARDAVANAVGFRITSIALAGQQRS